MVTPGLLASWERTLGYLEQARSHFSAEDLVTHAYWFNEVDEFIDHNELGLAYDFMASLARESAWDCIPLLEALALAAQNMGKDAGVELLKRRLEELSA